MKIYVPFKPTNPKSRLSKIMSEDERREFAFQLLLDVLDCCEEAVVLSASRDERLRDLKHEVDERDLDTAVTSRIKKEDSAFVMSDLALISKKIVKKFLDTDGDVVIAPGRKGGTNMLLSRSREFYTSYHYGSFLKHVRIAEKLGLNLSIFDSFYASIDIDDESDLLELMLHGKGKRSYEYLESIGFYVDFSEKEPKLKRA
ncbi:2-phospho-L-lactate guanylyltransferase CofC [Ferroglobus placidus DSM 10642]|uniref:2-phospho-L-lactate guanylyltransferase n=1 Tax=Ferroglobus placidus (strain DSM 10642 / AEDII12DO) TaxID=589924 RepID=COFC_FERPA|nr:2-phospho-L-lactate guanylyltransferase [Ferroglobus placidus]D3RZQ1.1 RecName: Full=2-phospho-L-lactate guanylyltransferase; Short=LP guanylyltransferase [Ferroglobus placidus DSM 10642]ADC65964.1 2-phospho-L-lactate guanylyltransferase CofC [Ferroglobus placidus DSM 10642]